MDAVLTVVVGAVLAGLFAFAGSVYGAWSAHRQWLKDARVGAYRDLLAAYQEIGAVRHRNRRSHDRGGSVDVDSIEAELLKFWTVLGSINILGPKRVSDAAEAFAQAVSNFALMDFTASDKDRNRLEADFVSKARSVLKSE